MGDIKSKIKYMICSNDFANSLLKIYFGVKKDGISHLGNVIREERYNKYYRKPWVVNKKEVIRQKKEFANSNANILIGISCEEKTNANILSSLISLSRQSVDKVLSVVCIGTDIKDRERLKSVFSKESGMCLYFMEDGKDVVSFVEKNKFDYYGEIQAGDLIHPYMTYFWLKEISQNNRKFLYYFDEWYFEDDVRKARKHNYKSDFSRISLYSKNYIDDFFMTRADVFVKLRGFDGETRASYYNYLLKTVEYIDHCAKETKSNDREIKKMLDDGFVHIKEPMYYKQDNDKSEEKKIENDLIEIKVLEEHFNRCDISAKIMYDDRLHERHIIYPINKDKKVSIIIPNKEHRDDLKRCIDSIETKTSYTDYEIIIVENGSTSENIKEYYRELSEKDNITICEWKNGFNYSAINNFGAGKAKGDYLVLLNNDVEIISPHWIEEMLMYAQMPEIGAVGCMLYYPDDTVQHAGVILGIGGVAGHSHKHFSSSASGYNERMNYVQELSAVTAACMMTRKDIYNEVCGLDEKFEVAFNDIDYCMKLREKGFGIIFTPYSRLYHYESISRGYETTEAKEKRFRSETERFKNKWGKELEEGDSYYNPHLTLRYENFELK